MIFLTLIFQEAERLEASRDEDEELGAVESVSFAMRPKDSDLQEIEEVELGADTEVDMNTEEDVIVDQKSGSQMCNSESEQACTSTEAEQSVVKKTESCSNNGLSEQSSPKDSVSSAQSVNPSSVSRIIHSLNNRQANVVNFTPLSSCKQSPPVTITSSQKLPGAPLSTVTANFPSNKFSETRKHSNSQRKSSPLEQAMREITSVTSADSQVSNNYQSSCVQQQSSWGVKQLPISSSSSLSNGNQLSTLHSISSYPLSSTCANDTFTTSQMTHQQPVFSSCSVQQRQLSSKNLQSQHSSAIRHASQISQQSIQEQVHQHQHSPIQHPYNYSSPAMTVQKAALPTCNIPQNASRAYNSVLPSQKPLKSEDML
uniref:Uncharacterized protein n=1 Tax=Wuchereria bancrofti TaxID=6293 RepID=A0A1I8EKI0_WUCBA